MFYTFSIQLNVDSFSEIWLDFLTCIEKCPKAKLKLLVYLNIFYQSPLVINFCLHFQYRLISWDMGWTLRLVLENVKRPKLLLDIILSYRFNFWRNWIFPAIVLNRQENDEETFFVQILLSYIYEVLQAAWQNSGKLV